MTDFEHILTRLYGEKALQNQLQRYGKAKAAFSEIFEITDGLQIFSAPGRTEICGNHTDHNCGKVLAAAVDLDVIAVVVPTNDGIITVKSEGFPQDTIDTSDISVHSDELNTSAALIRGVCAGFKEDGLTIGGFKAYTTSNVLKGSGVSSSAAFEVLIGTILSHLYNNAMVSQVKIAQFAQFAENKYFGKPSGLMDQMASSVGGFITIDFKDLEKPFISSINYDFDKSGFTLCIVDTKGNHADLTPEYAAIPAEMKSVARHFGKEVLREVDEKQIWGDISAVRKECGDRALSRALHFYDENRRVDAASVALKLGDVIDFLQCIKASGNSSFKYLQNIFAVTAPEEQGVVIGLYVAEKLLDGTGVCRVHGGGFAGTIQAFVPDSGVERFVEEMEKVFGKDCCHRLKIRPVGGIKVE